MCETMHPHQALRRVVFTIAILLAVGAMAVGLVAAGYTWVAPMASPLPVTDTITRPGGDEPLRRPDGPLRHPPEHGGRPAFSPHDPTLVA